jgi:hypothetical protein
VVDLRALLGILFFGYAAWAMSTHRRSLPGRMNVWGLVFPFGFVAGVFS